MVVYIQKKIKNIWRTILTVDSPSASSSYDHICRQYCHHKFRISMKKTDDMPLEPQGLSGDEALDALCNIPLVNLTCVEGKEAFKKIVHIFHQVCKRYQR